MVEKVIALVSSFCLIAFASLAFFCASDSTVLAFILLLLNRRHDYGLDLQMLSIDEGIAGYRDASLDVSHGE